MPERLASVFVTPALSGREHEGGILDRPCAHQHVPMRLAGLPGEGGRNGDEGGAGLGKRPMQQWKTQIVADSQAETSPQQIGDDGALTRLVATRLAVALTAGKIDIEHVNLVVARENLAARIDHE